MKVEVNFCDRCYWSTDMCKFRNTHFRQIDIVYWKWSRTNNRDVYVMKSNNETQFFSFQGTTVFEGKIGKKWTNWQKLCSFSVMPETQL